MFGLFVCFFCSLCKDIENYNIEENINNSGNNENSNGIVVSPPTNTQYKLSTITSDATLPVDKVNFGVLSQLKQRSHSNASTCSFDEDDENSPMNRKKHKSHPNAKHSNSAKLIKHKISGTSKENIIASIINKNRLSESTQLNNNSSNENDTAFALNMDDIQNIISSNQNSPNSMDDNNPNANITNVSPPTMTVNSTQLTIKSPKSTVVTSNSGDSFSGIMNNGNNHSIPNQDTNQLHDKLDSNSPKMEIIENSAKNAAIILCAIERNELNENDENDEFDDDDANIVYTTHYSNILASKRQNSGNNVNTVNIHQHPLAMIKQNSNSQNTNNTETNTKTNTNNTNELSKPQHRDSKSVTHTATNTINAQTKFITLNLDGNAGNYNFHALANTHSNRIESTSQSLDVVAYIQKQLQNQMNLSSSNTNLLNSHINIHNNISNSHNITNNSSINHNITNNNSINNINNNNINNINNISNINNINNNINNNNNNSTGRNRMGGSMGTIHAASGGSGDSVSINSVGIRSYRGRNRVRSYNDRLSGDAAVASRILMKKLGSNSNSLRHINGASSGSTFTTIDFGGGSGVVPLRKHKHVTDTDGDEDDDEEENKYEHCLICCKNVTFGHVALALICVLIGFALGFYTGTKADLQF